METSNTNEQTMRKSIRSWRDVEVGKWYIQKTSLPLIFKLIEPWKCNGRGEPITDLTPAIFILDEYGKFEYVKRSVRSRQIVSENLHIIFPATEEEIKEFKLKCIFDQL